jgi:beta-aspartyl-peptidase (threonine type)
MKYKNLSLENAANETIERMTEINGEGGFIAADALGNVVLPFNSEGMYRGWITSDLAMKIEIYK